MRSTPTPENDYSAAKRRVLHGGVAVNSWGGETQSVRGDLRPFERFEGEHKYLDRGNHDWTSV